MVRVDSPDGTTTFTKTCSVTNKPFSLTVQTELLDMWKERDLYVQDVFSHLTEEEREFLLSGMTPAEWDSLWGEENFE